MKNGQVGYCDNKTLGIDKPGGHYVVIKHVNGSKCEVNVVTSLERGKQQYQQNKLNQVRNGNTYSIPYHDANFREWSGITRRTITVHQSDITPTTKVIKEKHIGIVKKFFGQKKSPPA